MGSVSMYSGVIIGVILGFLVSAFCSRLITKVMLRKLIAAAEAEALTVITQGAELYHMSNGLLDLATLHADPAEQERLRLMQQVVAHRYAEWKEGVLEHLSAHHPSSMDQGTASWNAAMTTALKKSLPSTNRTSTRGNR